MEYLSTCIDQVNTFGDILQLVIVELIYKVKLLSEYINVMTAVDIQKSLSTSAFNDIIRNTLSLFVTYLLMLLLEQSN